MEQSLKAHIQEAAKELGLPEVSFSLEHPKELSHGDWATNIALILSKQADKNPKEVADQIASKLGEKNIEGVEHISVAGAGFINFTLSRKVFVQYLTAALDEDWGSNATGSGKKIMLEYTDPNPFKPFHIGHLMTNAIGESLARLTEFSGSKVIRANYQGDVGAHVAKAIYGLQQKGKPDSSLSVSEQAQYIGACYVYGSNEYEKDAEAKGVIDEINKKIYARSDTSINELYDWGRSVTLEAFEELYKILGTKFNYYFFESEMAEKGAALVKEYLEKGIFEESDGAVVFKAEKYNSKLHTRVFITSQGLPTYETKELGLTKTKFEKEHPDSSVVITAVEQKDYMAVATEAMRQIDASLAEKMIHITHGMMRFASGKMSSRKGNVITGESLLADAKALVAEKITERNLTQEEASTLASTVAVAAIKFAILKQALGGDIIYNEEQAVSFDGDSGPYLQYTAVRAKTLLQKGAALGINQNNSTPVSGTETLERIVARFPEVVLRAQAERAPHFLVTYLTELAQLFNSWYGGEKILDENHNATAYRLLVTAAVAQTLTNGLSLLGISVPDKM